MLGARPIRERVDGAPYQPGQAVRVVAAIDTYIHDVSPFIGKSGTVLYLEYQCGCAQTYPHDPMIGVLFEDGSEEEFWPEEMTADQARSLLSAACSIGIVTQLTEA